MKKLSGQRLKKARRRDTERVERRKKNATRLHRFELLRKRHQLIQLLLTAKLVTEHLVRHVNSAGGQSDV